MYELGWILTLSWVALILAGWLAHIVVTIYNAFKGTLLPRDTQEDAWLKQEIERWGLSGGAKSADKR